MKERNQSELDKIVFPELYNPFFRFNLSFFIAELHRFLWSLLAGYTLYKELKEVAPKFKISDFYKKKMPYLREIQGRSKSISLIKRILNGEKVDDVEVDYERRSDTLFTKLHNSIESLVMIDGLVFKAKMPVKGESHQFCLVLENSDAERRMASLHAKQHRAHVYLYTLFCKDFWTPSAFRLAYNVTSRCPNCAQMKARKKNKCALPNLTSDLMNKWAVDYKGPIMHGNSKYYILACVELNLRLVHFSIAKSLEAPPGHAYANALNVEPPVARGTQQVCLLR